jgi:uncharacterized protein
MTSLLKIALIASLVYAGVVYAAAVPKLQGRVNDYAGVLQPQTRRELENSLAQYERETTHQIAILTVPSLGGESIEAFSLRVANTWALGRKGFDNGVLVTLAPAEHETRIELGLGMNRYVSNADAKKIIEEAMIPAFREGKYDIGLRRGIDRLFVECRAYRVRH